MQIYVMSVRAWRESKLNWKVKSVSSFRVLLPITANPCCTAHQQKLKNAGGTKPAEIETDITRLVQDLEDLEDKRGSVHGYYDLSEVL